MELINKKMLMGIYGNVGSGKNLISVIDDYFTPSEIPIYTNFRINLKNAEMIEPEEVFDVFEYDSAIPVKKLVTDEAYSWFESRNSGSCDVNKFLSYLMFQSRKLGLNWKSIAQMRNTLDLRWRGMENKIINCGDRVLDMAGNSTDDFNYSFVKRSSVGIKIVNKKLLYCDAKKFFGLYDTNKRILPQDFDNLKMKIMNKDTINLNRHIDELVNELLSGKIVVPKTKLTQEWVRDALLRLNKSSLYASNVKVRLNERLAGDKKYGKKTKKEL